MSAIPDNFYADGRVRCGAVPILRDENDSPPERLLQAIWQHQRLRRDELKTLDGRTVRILHPGFHNLEGGPDFRGAVVQIGDDAPRSGDIELDLRASGWHAHGHDTNPAFRNVLLHVLWEGERPAAGAPPVLLMRPALDAPLGELSLWLGGEPSPAWPEEQRGQCCAPLRGLGAAELVELVQQAARVRLRSKAAQFQARARQAGWEQSLWEGLFRALGYKHNVWPMQRLAELRACWLVAPRDLLAVQARLLGLSGLLPAEVAGHLPGNEGYLRQIWDFWWRERDAMAEVILPKVAWRLHGIRPANHPQRRLALAAGWTLAGELAGKLERWCATETRDAALAASLLEALQVGPDDFWSWHWTLRSKPLKKQHPLLGATRLTDLAMNVVLPWLWSRAEEGGNAVVRQALEHRYFKWPAAEDNAVLRLARQRLLGGTRQRALSGAAAQQGLLQIVRDFCDHSNAICEGCKLPALVRELGASGASGTFAEQNQGSRKARQKAQKC